MSIQAFPEIENFQKLPRQVIVKGGPLSLGAKETDLRGIVINNIGSAVRDIKVNIVLFNNRKIPILNTSIAITPEVLHQGNIANFIFQLKDLPEGYRDYHLYSSWKFDN